MYGETTIGDEMYGMDSLGLGLGEMESILSALLARWGSFLFRGSALSTYFLHCTRFLLQVFLFIQSYLIIPEVASLQLVGRKKSEMVFDSIVTNGIIVSSNFSFL